MKRGKDEEKNMGKPMFPRLHVNDTEKGGPRAPPRNKMALYEQLSIPSQRVSSSSGVIPLNPKSTTKNKVPPASSSQGSGPERSSVVPRHLPPSKPTHLPEKLPSHRSDVRNGNSLQAQREQRKKFGEKDDFMVPVFVKARVGKSHDQIIDRESLSSISSSHRGRTVERQNISNKDPKQENLVAAKVSSERKENMKGGGQSGATDQSNREKINGPMKGAKTYWDQAPRGCAMSNLSRPHDGEACLNQESRAGAQLESAVQDDGCVEPPSIEVGNASRPKSMSHSGEDHGRCNEMENGSKHNSNGNMMSISLQLVNVDKGDDLSESSMVDSISDFDISPDDIVEIIGQKHFWKARRAIVTQQRVFTMQVFELHKLIKVQRLIAGSPHILLQHSAFLGKSSLKSSPAKKLAPESVVKPIPNVANCEADSKEPNEKMERSAENAVGKTSPSSMKSSNQSINYAPYAGNPQHVVTIPDNNMGPWCFNQLPGPQWLVPVMSPSEGLVYKPYLSPGLSGPVCGGHGPFGSTPMMANYPNPHCEISTSHHQGIGVFPSSVGPAYLPPYGMPVTNPAMSSSAVEKVNQFAGTCPVPGGIININTEQQSSCNVPPQENGSVSQPRKFEVSKGSDLQGSTASSPGERAKEVGISHNAKARDPFPLFPMVHGIPEEASKSHEAASPSPTQVIKVVPHNPRSATESAARIFRFIQEERKQYNPI